MYRTGGRGNPLLLKTGSGKRELVFTFRDLIDSRVNALNLLRFPHRYIWDPETLIIMRKHRKRSDLYQG
jgi:hypothetical protein